MRTILGTFFGILLITTAQSQEVTNSPATAGKNVRIEYRQYESFDLGSLEIKGQVIAPGDLTVLERGRKKFARDLYDRDEFHHESIQDVWELR